MENKYLKRFMAFTSPTKENEIILLFQAILPNDKDLIHQEDRTGAGYALSIYKMVPRKASKQTSKVSQVPPNYSFPEGEWLAKFTHTIKLPKPWAKDTNHITSLVILHNPATDSDSMATSDAPMYP